MRTRHEKQIKRLNTTFGREFDKAMVRVVRDEQRRIRENRAEAAWTAREESLMASGGPDDSSYRRDMIAAGRGHLLR